MRSIRPSTEWLQDLWGMTDKMFHRMESTNSDEQAGVSMLMLEVQRLAALFVASRVLEQVQAPQPMNPMLKTERIRAKTIAATNSPEAQEKLMNAVVGDPYFKKLLNDHILDVRSDFLIGKTTDVRLQNSLRFFEQDVRRLWTDKGLLPSHENRISGGVVALVLAGAAGLGGVAAAAWNWLSSEEKPKQKPIPVMRSAPDDAPDNRRDLRRSLPPERTGWER